MATAGSGEELTAATVAHRNPRLLFVGTTRGRVLRSDDGGATWTENYVVVSRTTFFGRERSADPRLEYALGLPGKSPLLQNWLRRQGLQTAGLNLQQLLVQKAMRDVSVNWLEVDWHDERVVYAGTTDGLYRSTDRGRTFLRIWQGRSGSKERAVTTVVSNPGDPRQLIVGTVSGLFYSRNRGTTFGKELNFYIRDSFIRGLFFDREQQGLVHMAMGGSAMASPDAGKNWITTHWDAWGPRADAQWISLGPNNVRLMGTRDGVFVSTQGGEMGTWKRTGRHFIGQTVARVLCTREAGQWYAATDVAIWKTTDAGAVWRKVMQTSGKEHAVGIIAHAGDASRVWVVTNRHVYHNGPRAPSSTPPAAYRKLTDVPALYALWQRILKKTRLGQNRLQRYKDRSPFAALLPTLSASATYGPSRETLLTRAFPYLHRPFTYFRPRNEYELAIDVVANWDISRLVFDRRQMAHFGRVERSLNSVRQELAEQVQRLYVEYVNVARTLSRRPPTEALAHEFQRLRLQEIAALFDGMSGGYFSRATGGLPWK